MSQIISENNINDQALNLEASSFFKRYISSKLLKSCGFYKNSGFSCMMLLQFLFRLIFTGKNLWRTLQNTSDSPCKKTTVYRFLQEKRYHWEKLLCAVAIKMIASINKFTSEERATALVIDDSLLSRNRSNEVELLSRTYDHSERRFYKGFRMLTLGWTDGSSFIPVNFRLMSSAKESNIYRFPEDCDRRSQAFKRREKARMTMFEQVLDLLNQAKKIPAKYVLFDSWFTMPKAVCQIKELGRNVIGMVKISSKIHYRYDGKWQDVKDIYSKVMPKDRKKQDVLATAMVQLRPRKKSSEDEWVQAKIVFVRNVRSKKDSWLALLSTDTDLTAEEIVSIYGKRWDIEVFFKMCKSHLALGKEFQTRSYDAQVATTAIVFLRYMMIAESVRYEEDQKTWGILFFEFCDEIKDIQYGEAIKALINTLIDLLHKTPSLTKKQVSSLLEKFWQAIPTIFTKNLQLNV